MEENSVAQKIRDRRLELKLTQRQVADYVGVTEATVSRWESGEIDNMRRDKIAKLASVLNVSPLLIMGIETETTNLSLNSEESILISIYRALDNAKRQTVLNILAFLNSPQSMGNMQVQNNNGNGNFFANNGDVSITP